MLRNMQALLMAALVAHSGRALLLSQLQNGDQSGVALDVQDDVRQKFSEDLRGRTGSSNEEIEDMFDEDSKAAWNDMGMGPNDVPIMYTKDKHIEWVNWTLCGVAHHSNLGGLGPDSGEESLRYYNIATTKSGQAIDLVVTTNSTYEPKSVEVNGLVGGDSCFGALNLKSNRKTGHNQVDLLFTVYLSGTNTSVAMNKHFFTVFDFDSGSSATEHATFTHRVSGLYYLPDHEMDITGNLSTDINITFSSTQQGTGSDNPKNPMDLTEEQKRRAVMVSYDERAQWKVTIAVEGGSGGGRNFVFGGFSNLMPLPTTTTKGGGEPTTTTTTCYTQDCVVWADPHVSGFDNDGNQGPKYLSLLSGRHTAAARTFDRRPMDVAAYDDGDFWLVKSDAIHIQARFRLSGEFIPDRAAIGAVAVGGPFLEGHKFMVEPLDGQVTFDGVALPDDAELFRDTSGLVSLVSLGGNDLEIRFPMNVMMTFRRLQKHVDVKITMPPVPGGIDGECGNFDGIPENDAEENILERMGDLRIDDSMLLFDKAAE